MASPFPGMDPYLESKERWSGFHQFLAVEIAAQLNPLIGPKYFADVEVHTVTEEINLTSKPTNIYPDTGILERPGFTRTLAQPSEMTLLAPDAPLRRTIHMGGRAKLRTVQIRRTEDGRLVTSIEILSPFNKTGEKGLTQYRNKREKVLRSPVHLVEIDLLRGGTRPGPELFDPPLNTDYVIVVNRDDDNDYRVSEIWDIAISTPLPLLPIPLLSPDSDVTLDTPTLFNTIYQRAGYEWRIDYSRPIPSPKLRPEMIEWMANHLPEVGGNDINHTISGNGSLPPAE